MATFVIETKAILKTANIPDNYPMVAMHNLPGLVYLLNGYSPATPWYFDAEWLNEPEYNAKLHHTNCLNIGRIKQFEPRPPVFLINAYMLDRVKPCLQEHGFYLTPPNYTSYSVLNPFVKAENVLFNRIVSDSLIIYIPQ